VCIWSEVQSELLLLFKLGASLVSNKSGGNPTVWPILLDVHINYYWLYNNLPAQNDERQGQSLNGETIVKIRVTVVHDHVFCFNRRRIQVNAQVTG
jgi:hypothetical protein